MTGREHMAIGVMSTALIVGAIQTARGDINLPAMLPALGAAAAGSLAPDLDHPSSLAGMTIPVALIGYPLAFFAANAYERAHPETLFKVASMFPESWSLAAWISLGVGLTLALISIVFTRMFGHRGIVHSFAFGIGASLLALAGLALFDAPLWLAAAFLWGWIAHLIADSTTPAGLDQLFWPLGRESV